jgi:hypothetical protein
MCALRSGAILYPLGVGVSIELFIEERGVAKVLVLCSANFPEFPELSFLPESDRVRLAIDDFAGNRLNATAESALKWQGELKKLGHVNISAVITPFAVSSNNRVEHAHCVRSTHNGETPLLAAHAALDDESISS